MRGKGETMKNIFRTLSALLVLTVAMGSALDARHGGGRGGAHHGGAHHHHHGDRHHRGSYHYHGGVGFYGAPIIVAPPIVEEEVIVVQPASEIICHRKYCSSKRYDYHCHYPQDVDYYLYVK